MLAVVFAVSCLSVCGFYVYVLVQLRREQKREDAHKKHLPEHFHEMESDQRRGDAKFTRRPEAGLFTNAQEEHNIAHGSFR